MSTVEQYALLWVTVVTMAGVFNVGLVCGIWVSNFIKRKESQ